MVGSADGFVYGLDPKDGAVLWKHPTQGPMYGSAAFARGVAAIGGGDGRIYGIEPKTGKETWRFELPPGDTAFVQSPAAADGERFYFGSWDKKLYALNSQGEKLWEFATGGPVVSSPAIGADGAIYFGSHDGTLYILSASGEKLRHFSAAGPVISSPALDQDGGVFFTSVDGFLYALNSDGGLRWKLHTTSFREGSPVLGLGGMIFLCSHDGLWAITPDGRQTWYRGKEDMDGTPAITADGSVIFVFRDGQVINYDHNRGHRWMHYIYPVGSASPAIGENGTIYLPGAVNRSLTAINGTSPLAATPWPKFRGNTRNTGNLADHWR